MTIDEATLAAWPDFRSLPDIAAERLGGRVLLANDEFFAPKEALLRPGRGAWDPEGFTETGKVYDGWETRRRRTPGNDWCIVRLGMPAEIVGIDVDTNHFVGNFPEACSLDACRAEGDSVGSELSEASDWVEVLPRSPLRGDRSNLFDINDGQRWTHVRLNIYPDGGVARLRVHGIARPDWDALGDRTVDVASVVNGGVVVARSDDFFGLPHNMLFPDRPPHMGDGWETRRRRGPGHDWCIVQLGTRADVERIIVDTTHFKGNFPESCSIEGADCRAPDETTEWRVALPQTTLTADSERAFNVELSDRGPFTHIRVNIYPDGGLARLRVFGQRAAAGGRPR